MTRISLLCFVISVLLIDQNQSTTFCPSPSIDTRCMDETRLNCNDSLFAASDFHCCAGLQCIPVWILATDTEPEFNTTMCVPSSSMPSNSLPNKLPSKRPPIMASAWSAATTYYNMSNGDTGWGHFWYDAAYQALRTDFYPMCPFLQMYGSGVDSNYVPCTVIFYHGNNYFVYPTANVCCNYSFPVWQPDWLCRSNATYNGTEVIDGKQADFWMVEWVRR